MKVSIVIASYNRPQMLCRTLFRLMAQGDKNYEVLVANDDDADVLEDTDAVVNAFKKEGMPVTSFCTGQYKRGMGWSVETYPYNVCIRKATGDVVIINSSDVMSITNTINQHRLYHMAAQSLVVFSTVHALTQDVQNKIDDLAWQDNPFSLLFRGSCYKMFTGKGRSYTAAYSSEEAMLPYHFLCSVRRQYLTQIRGFDEDFYGMMPCGDDDLADRLKRIGCEFVYAPNIIAVHQFHGDPNNLSGGKFGKPNPLAESGHSLFHNHRRHQVVVRNAKHEWGQYPRDMKNLPDMSGV